MIRPIQSALPLSLSKLPSNNVSSATVSHTVSPFPSFDLRPSSSATSPLVDTPFYDQNSEESETSELRLSRFGMSDRHALTDQHSLKNENQSPDPLRQAFREFVGQTLFGQLLSSMRNTVGKPAYFHGGRAEEVFTQQLDQVLVERITEASASTVADPMYELFNLQRNQ